MMEYLPNEILALILKNLSLAEACGLRRVCRIWQLILDREHPLPPLLSCSSLRTAVHKYIKSVATYAGGDQFQIEELIRGSPAPRFCIDTRKSNISRDGQIQMERIPVDVCPRCKQQCGVEIEDWVSSTHHFLGYCGRDKTYFIADVRTRLHIVRARGFNLLQTHLIPPWRVDEDKGLPPSLWMIPEWEDPDKNLYLFSPPKYDSKQIFSFASTDIASAFAFTGPVFVTYFRFRHTDVHPKDGIEEDHIAIWDIVTEKLLRVVALPATEGLSEDQQPYWFCQWSDTNESVLLVEVFDGIHYIVTQIPAKSHATKDIHSIRFSLQYSLMENRIQGFEAFPYVDRSVDRPEMCEDHDLLMYHSGDFLYVGVIGPVDSKQNELGKLDRGVIVEWNFEEDTMPYDTIYHDEVLLGYIGIRVYYFPTKKIVREIRWNKFASFFWVSSLQNRIVAQFDIRGVQLLTYIGCISP